MQSLKKLDWGFIAAPLPFLLLTTYAFVMFARVGDFYFHANYSGDSGYPQFVAFLRIFFEPFLFGNEWALFVISILFSTVFPYILLFEITKNKLASIAYIYVSGVPLMLQYLFFVPQAVIQTIMLLAILNPWFFLLFALGPWIHGSWLPALGVAIAGRYFYMRDKNV